MSSKRSILNRVLYLNLTMAVVLTLVFLCTSGLYARQLTRERYNLASTTLTKVNTDFQRNYYDYINDYRIAEFKRSK